MKALHVGCGGNSLPAWLSDFSEVRVDIDARCKPDVVASMTDLGEVGEFDAVFCQHALEHLHPHEVQRALSEFRRVLKDGGILVLFVPDTEGVADTDTPLFDSPRGPISGSDLLHGHRASLNDSPYMAHHCAFTSETLADELNRAGFSEVHTQRLSPYNLFAGARK